MALIEIPRAQEQQPHLESTFYKELADVIGVTLEQLDIDRGFDEYGLDSIDAVIATTALSDRLGIDVAPEMLLIYRTPSELYAGLNAGDASPNRSKTHETPVILFPGGAGRDGALARLSSRCPATMTFRSISVGRWQQWIEDGIEFDGLVASACEQVETYAPHGALHLAGYSQGGQLAFASAVALAARGREVKSVSLFDSDGEVYPRRRNFATETRWVVKLAVLAASAIGRRAGAVHALRPGYRRGDTRITLIGHTYNLMTQPKRARNWLLGLARQFPNLFAGRPGQRIDHQNQILVFSDLWQRWLSGPGSKAKVGSEVFLFRSEVPGCEDRGWSSRCESFVLRQMRGDHRSMFDWAHLDDVARCFSRDLGYGTGGLER